jgi:hypothetical protein
VRIVLNIDKSLLDRLYKKKEQDGFGGKRIEDWLRYNLRDVTLSDSVNVQVARNTRKNLGQLWMRNLADNLPAIRDSGKCLRDIASESACSVPAVIVGAGPSVWQHNHLKMLKNFEGVIVCTDKMFIPCLREGLEVDYVVSVDAHPELIAKFFDDDLAEQSNAKVLLCLQTHPNTVEVCKKRGLNVHWFFTSQDNPEADDSSTRSIIYMTSSEKNPLGVQSIMSGGNCGTTALVIAIDVLKHEKIALIGFDFGYPEGLPAEKTSYYSSIFRAHQSVYNDPMASLKTLSTFGSFYHPVFKTIAKSDPVFDGYRLSLYEILSNLSRPCEIFNATEGGTLFYPRVLKCVALEAFLKTKSKSKIR